MLKHSDMQHLCTKVMTSDDDGGDPVVHGFGPCGAAGEGPTEVLEDNLRSMLTWDEVRDASATCLI